MPDCSSVIEKEDTISGRLLVKITLLSRGTISIHIAVHNVVISDRNTPVLQMTYVLYIMIVYSLESVLLA